MRRNLLPSALIVLTLITAAQICQPVGLQTDQCRAYGQKSNALSQNEIRLANWILGQRVSLTVLAQCENLSADMVKTQFAGAQQLATALGAQLPPLPKRANDKIKDSVSGLHYLLHDFNPVYDAIGKKYGVSTANLLEISVKSNILILLYQPGDKEGAAISTVIKRDAPSAKLPASVWKPLTDAIDSKQPYTKVKAAIIKMDKDIHTLYQ